jgi:hypothetical protein
MDGYKQEIVELVGKLTPTTPPEVRSERKQQETKQTDSIALEVKEVAELYERTTQIWTSLEEDEGIQQLDQREEKMNVAVQDLKQRQKTMSISDRIKSMQEMKNMQARFEDNPRGKTDKTGSVGAPAGESREDDSRVGNRERKTGTSTLREYKSVGGAHNNAGGGDPDRKECAGQDTSRCTHKEVPGIGEICAGGTHCLSGSG